MGKKSDLFKKIIKSPDFWVRFDAVCTGVAVLTEAAVLAMYGVPAAPLLLAIGGAIAAPLLAGAALYSLYIGATGTWDFVKSAWRDVYNKPAPKDEKQGLGLRQWLKENPVTGPPVKKMLAWKPVRNFLDNTRLGRKVRDGMTQQERNFFMTGLNIKGSLFVGGSAAAYIVMHTIALPAFTVSAALTTAVAVACFYAGKAAFDITCSTKVLVRTIREKIAARKARIEAERLKTGAKPRLWQRWRPAPIPMPMAAAEDLPAVKLPEDLSAAFEQSASSLLSPPIPPPPPCAGVQKAVRPSYDSWRKL
ncbi:MAG: hypothetical protein EPN97_00095 [Alphaproteobacteria bacterium]|nr:MAG: hypothetical protein EPN97_00095 [Alphaproteobacteria bacterium]